MEINRSQQHGLDWRRHRDWATETVRSYASLSNQNLQKRLTAELPRKPSQLSTSELSMSTAFAYAFLEQMAAVESTLSIKARELLQTQSLGILLEFESRSGSSFTGKEVQQILCFIRNSDKKSKDAPWWVFLIEDGNIKDVSSFFGSLKLSDEHTPLQKSIEHIRQNEPFLAWKELRDLSPEQSLSESPLHHYYRMLAFGLFADVRMIESEIRRAGNSFSKYGQSYACLYATLLARNEFDWLFSDKTLLRPLEKLISLRATSFASFLNEIVRFQSQKNGSRLLKSLSILKLLQDSFALVEPEQQFLALAIVHRLLRKERWAHSTEVLGATLKEISIYLSSGTSADLWNLSRAEALSIHSSELPHEEIPSAKLSRALSATSVTFRISSFLGPRKFSKLLSGQNSIVLSEAEIEGVLSILVPYLSRMKGPLLKVGQTMSYMYLGLPTQLLQKTKQLQSESQALSFKIIYQQIEKNPALHEQIAQIDSTPLGVGSIGQVHRAQLKDGRQVAIKVKFPEIEKIIQNDLDLLRFVVGIVELLAPRLRLRSYVKELREQLLKECDYHREAASQQKHRQYMQAIQNLYIPDVYPDLSTEQILVTEYVEGLSYAQACQEGTQEQKNLWGRALVEYTVTCCRDGSFNSDPHPGNLLFQKDRLVYLDFGSVCDWQEREQNAWNRLIMACLQGQPELILNAMNVYKKTGINLKNAEKMATVLNRPLPGSWTVPGSQSLEGNNLARQIQELADIAVSKTNPLSLPKEFILGMRVYFGHMAVVSGLGAQHDWNSLVHEIMRPWNQKNL